MQNISCQVPRSPNMHFFGIALISVLCVVCTSAQSPSYWVDGSCDKYQQLPAAINEATDMANRAAQRMQDSSDSYFQRVLNKIFNNPPASSNAAVNSKSSFKLKRWTLLIHCALAVTSGIAAITRVVGDTDARRQTSEIRVYCDDNARWSLQEDIAGDPKPNSGRLDKDKVWIDKTNHMFVTGSPFICQGNTQAETYSRSGPATGEPPKRNTMTICSSQFAVPSTMNVATLYGKSPDPTDFTKINSVSTFGALVSVTVLHEVCPQSVEYLLSRISWLIQLG